MRLSDQERRLRLVRRHHLGRTAGHPSDVVESIAALHSSDPVTPFLASWARVPGFEVADLERELYEDRRIWRMHSMRRTLFLVPVGDAPVFAAVAAEIARKERVRLAQWVGGELGSKAFEKWLERLVALILEALDGRELSTRQLTEIVPELERQITVGAGKWAATVPVSSRVLYLMAMEGFLVRTRPAGTWRSSQYRWAVVADWFGTELGRIEEGQARATLARRYLATHAPVTMTDLRWWTGWTLKAAKEALSEVEVSTVELDSGETGLVLGEDDGSEPMADMSVALLPALDSTTMGWKERDWYLGAHGTELFDTNGNAGPTVWVDGRVVGGWGQRGDAQVVYHLLEEVVAEAGQLIDGAAGSLTDWLDGVIVMPRFPSPLGRRLAD